MLIRQEKPTDYAAIDALIREAFATAEHADGNEQDLVAALRSGSAYVPELALVAEVNGHLAGHILFTKATVGGREVLALAPLSVKPAYQRQGVGTALIREGHEIAKRLGYAYVLVLGSERYYPRFGYAQAEQMGATLPAGFPSVHFMAVRLRDDAAPLHGAVGYAKEFGL